VAVVLQDAQVVLGDLGIGGVKIDDVGVAALEAPVGDLVVDAAHAPLRQLIARAQRGPAVAAGPAAGAANPSAAATLVAGPNCDLTDALVAARGKDSFAYVDLARIIGTVAALFDDPRAKMLAAGASAPIPTYLTFASDGAAKQVTFTWTVTPAAFVGAGAIIQGLNSLGAPPK